MTEKEMSCTFQFVNAEFCAYSKFLKWAQNNAYNFVSELFLSPYLRIWNQHTILIP
jgi:hypothetical protein